MLKIFTVYDSKAEAYLQPFYAQATGAAVRMFESAAKDPEHHFHKHAGDYTLFELGSFDEQTGKLEQLPNHINLGNAIALTADPMAPITDLPTRITQEGTS